MGEYKDLLKKGFNYLDLTNLSKVGERDHKLDDLPDLSKILNEFLNETSNRKIPCNPKSKLISDNMIVGIKTITNQIIPVVPIPKTDGLDDLDEEVSYASYETVNNLLNDEEMLTSESVDEERSKMIKKIELEKIKYIS